MRDDVTNSYALTFLDDDQAVVAGIKVLVKYLAPGPNHILSRAVIKRACRVLGVDGYGGEWRLPWDYRSRAEVAGLHPSSFEVVDEVRWAHAIDFMRAHHGLFQLQEFRRWLCDHPEPSSVPPQKLPIIIKKKST